MKYFVTSRLSENIAETPEGFLICTGVSIARTGVMEYGRDETPLEVGQNGIVKISRDADEVFKPETIASFEGKPLTIGHPNDFVNADNWKELAKGTIQNVRRGKGEKENDIVADILVTDAEAIRLVKSGMREVSCGYEAEYIQAGDGIGKQTNIIGNHLALVDQGRAGASYAINDHKGVKSMNWTEKIKSIFGKAQDEAMKVVEEAEKAKAAATDDDKTKTKDKAKDDDVPKYSLDEFKAMADALRAANPSSGKPSEMEDEEKEDDDKAKDEEKDDDKEKAKDADLEGRIGKLEAICEKLVGMMGDAYDADKEDESEDEEMEDDDFENSHMVGDEASRIEILAPGLKAKGKEAKKKALQTAYATKDGKVMIETLNGGKALDFKKADKKTIDHLFIGASEMLKVARTKDLSKLKQTRDFDEDFNAGSGAMTADKINEINEKHYKGVH